MGSLKLPAAGPIYLDSAILIYTVETHVTYAPLLVPLWRAMTARQAAALTSALSRLEVLVHPLRHGDASLLAAYRQMLDGTQLAIAAITDPIISEAARLRAVGPSLRTPDAIHAATALTAGCAMFLTNDRRLRSVPALPVTILDDVLSAP